MTTHAKTKQGWKFQVEVPPQLNTKDMNERGERFGPMSIYGGPYDHRTIDRACEAWEVVAKHRINPTHNGKMPEITNAGGPEFMLLFKDGLWRRASFKGLSGPPWFHVDFEGWPGVTGEIAHLHYQIHYKKKSLHDAKQRVATIEGELMLMCDKVEALSQEAHGKPKE